MAGGIGAASTLQDLPELLASFGEAPALISFNAGAAETLTFKDLAERARNIAKGLRNRGVGAGEPIGILAPNGPLWVTACLGTLAAGAAVVPLDAQQTKAEQARLLKISGCRFLLGDLEVSGVDPAVRDGSFNSPLSEGSLILYALSSPSSGEQAATVPGPPLARPSDLALIVHTPGTTGTPKAVPLSHANILSNLSALAAAGVAGPLERALMPLPLHHIYPLVVGLLLPLCTGGSVVLPGGIGGPELARALRLGGATVLIGVPRLYETLLAAIIGGVDARRGVTAWAFPGLLGLSIALARRGQRRFGQLAFKPIRRNAAPRLYRLVSGGAKLEEETELKLLGLGYEVLTGYGLSETGPVVTFNRPGRSRIGSGGEPSPGVELRIAEPKANGVGEIEVRGPNVFAGYRNDPDEAKTAFTADGWFRTGDLGWMGADGSLYIGRRKKRGNRFARWQEAGSGNARSPVCGQSRYR
jgi:long-chain acyl-CoA synthetase